MLRRTFNFFLVVFLIVFTAAGVALLAAGLMTVIKPLQTNGIFGVAGGASNRAFTIFVALVLSLLVVGGFLITRRIKHR